MENCRGFPLKLNQLECELPSDTKHRKLDKPSIDLLNRLLDVDPQNRLKSLIGLKRIAMYKGYDFEMVKLKKVSIEEEQCPYRQKPTDRSSHNKAHSTNAYIDKIPHDVLSMQAFFLWAFVFWKFRCAL